MLQDRILDLPVFLLGLNCVAPTRNPLLHPPLARCYGQEPASDPKSSGFRSRVIGVSGSEWGTGQSMC